MKSKLLPLIAVVVILSYPNTDFAQAPALGTTSTFALFTGAGAFNNTGTTIISGDIGTNTSSVTGSPTVTGSIQTQNAASAQAATDVATAFSDLGSVSCGSTLTAPLGNNQVLTAGVYCVASASAVNGNLTLDGQCNPNALFIIKIGGALTTSATSNIILINSASISNVYWQVTGAVNLGAGSVFRGTVIANGAISISAGAILKGRAITTAGDININTLIATRFEGGLWNGNTSSDFATATNWSYGSVPTEGENISFGSSAGTPCNLDGNRIIGNLTNASDKNLSANGFQLTIQGSISQTSTGKIIASATGSAVKFTGCAAQSIPASTFTSNTLTNLEINNSSGVTIGGTLNVTGILTLTSGTLTTGSYLTLISNASGTAEVAEISSGSISGNITVERYIPANGRKYRFLASPVGGGTTMQWRDNGNNTSGRGTQITGLSGTVDASTTNQASAFFYDEDDLTGSTNIDHPSKWDAIDGNTTLTNGQGYRVFIRGDRSISLTTVNTSNNVTTLWVQGTYPASTVTLPVTYTAGAAQGWSLVGNPYPCTIDWDLVKAQGSSDYANMNDAIYIWNPGNTTKTTGGYASYVAGSGSGTPFIGTRYISSGQGFFVKANAGSPVLKIKEAQKVSSNSGSNFFKKSDLNPNSLRLKLFADSQQVDDAVLYFKSGASKNFDSKFDAYDLTEGIGFLTDDGLATLAISGRPELAENDKVKLAVILSNGTYRLGFSDLNSFDQNTEIYLLDKYLSKNIKVNNNDSYTFDIAENNPFTFGNDRFELVIGKASTGMGYLLPEKVKLSVYPNPTIDVLYVHISNLNAASYDWSIVNLTGQLIKTGFSNKELLTLNTSDLAPGSYFIGVKNEKLKQVAKFVK